VRRLGIGDRVYSYMFANPKGGFYAEYVAVDGEAAAQIPRSLDFRDAGAAAVTALTALQGVDALRLRQGETVLIFGATGAVGTLAIQFAKLRRARVIATATGPAATRLVRRLGADAVIDARSAGMVERLRRLAPDGIDAVLAFAGGEGLEKCLDFMKANGRLVYPNGVEPEPRRRLAIRQRGFDAEANPRQFARLGRAVTRSRLRAPIAAAYPLAQAAKAHKRLERGRVLGRIVLRIKRG
jgi:NADPH2:quinone reductase